MTRSPNPRFSRRRLGLSLTEMLFAVTISSAAGIGIMGTFISVVRAQATSADASRLRMEAFRAVEQLSQDIRDCSATAYNEPTWMRLPADANTRTTPFNLELFNPINGDRITWTFDRSRGVWRRSITNIVTNPAATVTNYPRWAAAVTTGRPFFADFQFEEVRRQEYANVTGTLLSDFSITSIRLRGRVLLTVPPRQSTVVERDGNNDGSYRNDRVGNALFGLTNNNDNPGWQFIFNTEAAFRSS